MTKKRYENWGDVIYWAYASLNMLMAAMAQGKEKYDRQCYMIRSTTYRAYKEGRWQIHSLSANNNWKVVWGKQECWYCRRPVEVCGKLAVEHVFPKSRGGDDNFDNIAYACRSCNSSKGTKDLIEWMVEETGFSPPLNLICIYLKLVYKFSVEHDLMNLHREDLTNTSLPFNPISIFQVLQWIEDGAFLE